MDLLLPGLMDGVPGFNGLMKYNLMVASLINLKSVKAEPIGIMRNSKGQEQDGLYGALVIYPKGKQSLAAHEQTQRDYVVMLSDFHESSSATDYGKSEKVCRILSKSA